MLFEIPFVRVVRAPKCLFCWRDSSTQSSKRARDGVHWCSTGFEVRSAQKCKFPQQKPTHVEKDRWRISFFLHTSVRSGNASSGLLKAGNHLMFCRAKTLNIPLVNQWWIQSLNRDESLLRQNVELQTIYHPVGEFAVELNALELHHSDVIKYVLFQERERCQIHILLWLLL